MPPTPKVLGACFSVYSLVCFCTYHYKATEFCSNMVVCVCCPDGGTGRRDGLKIH